jgi:hypothetical protein
LIGIDIVAFEREPARAEPLLEQAGKAPPSRGDPDLEKILPSPFVIGAGAPQSASAG